MKTEIIRRPLFVTLTLLTLVALLLGSAAPALADPSPWEQPSPGGGDFGDGTTNGTAVIGGAVQLTQASGALTMSAHSYDWAHSNTIWDTDHVELNSSLQWVQDVYLTNLVQKTGAGEARVRYIQNIDITGVERVNVRASHRRQGDDVNGDNDNNTHLRVLVGPVELINEYRRSTGWTTYNSGPSGAVYDFVQMYLEGTTWNGNHSIAQNNLLDVDFEKTIYASPGTFMHTYNAGHQVDWDTFSPDVTTPSGSSVGYTFWTSDNGSTWTPRSNWPAVQNNPSQYLRVQATLSTSDNLQTPTLNDIDITYNYYQSSGTFTSSTRDPLANGGTQVDDWGSISWSANLPTGTDIQFQIATSAAGTPNTYVGPDGTAGTYYTNGQAISDFHHANDRYIRYRAYFSVDAAHQASTPRLDEVTITYNQEPQAPTLTGPSGNINDDTPTFQWNAPSDPDGDADFRYHLQVDNHNDFSSPEVDVTNINALNYTSGALAQGAHWWRVRARDTVQGAGFSDPYGAWSNVFQITIDSQEPDSWIDTGSVPPAEPEHYGTDANPWPGQIDGGASDPAPATGVNLVEVLVHDMTGGEYWNGAAWVTTAPADWPDASGANPWSFPLAATGILTDGHTYEIFSKATDNVGNGETTHGNTRFLYDTTVGFGGRIWNDANGNGILDGGESGISGVTVNLYDATPALIASDETDASGDYSFSGPALGLAAGAYTIEVDEADAELDGLTLTSDPDTPLTADYDAGEKVTGLDFGYGPFALIEGYVFDDNGAGSGAARDGVQNGDEPGLPNITVSLGGSSLPDEVTDADGRYRFKGLAAGSYNVNPDENDADMPDYYVATSPDPLAVSDVELGHTYSERNVGYALPPAADKQLYLRYIGGRRLSREPGTDTRTFGVSTSHYTWPLISPVIGDVGLDTSQDAIVHVYVPDAGASATMEAEILDGSTSLGSGSVAVSGAGWYDVPVSLTDNTIHDGNQVVLSIYRTSGSDFDIRVDGAGTYRAYVQLPVLSYVKITALNTYDAAYPGGAETSDFETHDTVYVRVAARDPFGDYDITAASVNIPGVGNFAMAHVGDGVTNDTRIFEYAYVDADEGVYDPVAVTVDEGSEGTVEASSTTSFRVRSADVWVDKSADPTTVQSNDVVTFTLDYGNAGALAAQDVIVTDTLPAGLTYAGMVVGPAPAINGQQLTWNRGALASGFGGQLVFNATVQVTGAESGTFTNQVEISTSTGEADTSDNNDDVDVTLSQHANLTIDKDCDTPGHVVAPGDTVMYTILVQNTDYADATGGTIDDPVPDDTTFVGARLDPPGAGTLGAPPNLVTGLTVPGFDGANPGQVTLYYTVTVDSPLANGLGIVNAATVDSAQTDPVTAVHTDTVSSDHDLSVTKWPSDNPAQAGDPLTYTIQYGVTGNEPAPNVVIEDTYPANSAYVDCDGGLSCSEDSGIVTWNLGTLDPVASGVVTLVVQVNSPQPDHTPLENHVEIGDDDGEFAQFDYSGFVGSGHTLALTKSDSPDPVQAGGQIVYTLDYGVSGNENAAGVLITDTVPASTTFASCTGGCTGPDVNGVLTWTIGAVNAGSGGSVQFSVDVADPLPDGAEIYNAAWISDTNGGAPAGDGETTTVEADHGYTIVKAVSPDPVEAGGTLYYTITWGLSGNEPVSGIFIEDQIPDHTTFSSCGGGVSCGEAGGIVTWQLGDAPSGDAGGVVTFTVQVESPLQSGLLLHNTATVDDDDGDRAETSNDAATTTHSDHELWIAKTDDPDPVDAGALLAYTIDVGVTGDSNGYATGVVITDCVPANTTFHSASGGAEPDANGCLQWNLGTLAPSATRQVTFTVQVASPLVNETVIHNQAAVFDNEAKYETATAETIVHSDHELNVTKSGAPDPVAAVTGHIDYTINYNVPGSGNEPALGVVITDAVPANTVYVGGSCQPSGICSEAGGVVTWNVGDLVPGDSGAASFRVTVPAPLPNNLPITNTVHAYDLDGEHDEYTEVVNVSSDHSLNIDKSDYPDPVQAGGLITYTISYNVPAGYNEPAPDAIIEDYTPADTTFWSASGGVSIDAPGQGSPGMVRFHLGRLVPGDSGTVQLVVRVDSPLPNNTYIFNSASISDDDGERDDVYDVGTRVVSDHDLEISKSDDPDPVDAGALINYTIVYTVTGNQSAPNVTIRDTIPPNTTFESCSGGNYCFYNSGIGQVIWGLGRQNPGTGQVLLQVQANTPLPNGTILHNNVEISDDDGRYASYHEETEVSSDHALAISKSDEPDPVEAGGQLVYTLHWQATGNEPAPNVTISDQVPANTSYVGCSPAPCSESGGTVTWELGTIESPDEGDVTLTVEVDNLLPDGTLLYNTPTIQDNETPSVFGDEITTTVHSAHQLAVSKADDPDPVEAGAQLDYTIAYTVTGNQYAPNVIVVDTIPDDTTYVTGSCSGAPCVEDGGVVTWTLGTLAPPDSGTLGFSVDVASPLPNGASLFNFVTISDDDGVTAGGYEETIVSSDHALSIAKSDAPYDPVQAGELLTYTIDYGPVTGNEAAPNVVIEDTTPAHTTFYTATGGLSIEHPGVGGAGLVRYHLGNLDPGDSGQVLLVVRVDDPLPNNTVLNNSVAISDGDGESADDDETTLVHSAHTFVLEKYDTPDPVAPEQIINYTLHWEVVGNEAAQNIVITDTIPANTTFEGCSGCVLYPQGYVQWTLNGSHAPGAWGDESLQVRVDTPLENGTPIYNTARIRDGNDGAPVQVTIDTTVESDHELHVSKSAPSAIGAGQTMTYTIQYNVTGDEPAPSVVITDAVPAHTVYAGCGPAPCNHTAGVVTWDLGDLDPDDYGAVSLAVTVDSPLADGTEIWNTAHIYDADDGYAEDDALTTVTSGHGFSLNKRDNGYDPVQAGGQVVYTIDWSVAGTEIAQDVVINDTLPDHTTFTGCGPAPCSEAGGVVTWDLGNQDPNASGTVTVAVDVASPLPNGTLLTNQAEIGDSNDGLPADDSEDTTVNSSHVLDVEKNGPTTVDAGGQIVYTIEWSVTGNETADDLIVDDVTPVNTTFASASGAAVIDDPGVGNSGLVRYHLGDQLPGANGTLTLVVNVNSPLPDGTVIENTATIADSNGGATDSSEVTTEVESSHAFVLTKSDTPDPIAPDQIINYTIHWEVTGNEQALDVLITDTLPANTSLVNCGDCVVMGSWVYWERGNRNPGSSGDISLQARVDSPLEDGIFIHNIARISDDNGATPVEATADTEVQSDHELHVTKNAPSAVEAGQYINYTIEWSVSGNEPAPSVTITDAIPANTVYVAGSCQPALLCSEAGGVVTWNLSDRLPGENSTAQFTVQVDDPLPDGTEIWNTAHIYDADDGYAEDTTLTTVTSGHGFSLEKRDDSYDPVEAGGQVVYTIDWSVAGTETADDVIISDALPAHTTFTGCGPAPCNHTAGVVTWDLGNQDPGASGTVTVAVDVASPLPNGTQLVNEAEISDSNGGLPADEGETTTVHSGHVLDVEKSGPATVDAGGQIVYTIEWSVTGNETALDLIIEDSTPDHTTFVSAEGPGTIDNPGVGNSGIVRYHLGDQLPGANGTVTLTVSVDSPLDDGTPIHNQANISDDNGGVADSDTADTTVVSSHGFVLTKSDNPDPVSPDGLINYTIHWEVTGNEAAQSVVITDAIPANTTFESCGACVLMGDYVRWELDDRDPGDSGDVFLQVHVAPVLPDGTVVTNTAHVFDGNGGPPEEAQATTTVRSGHVLVLEKSAPGTVDAGGQIVYTLSYEVTGDEVAPNAIISDVVPANTTFNGCQPAGCSETGGVVTWDLGTLDPGESGIVQLTVDVDEPLDDGTPIVNDAYFSDDDEGYAEDSATTIVASAPDLSASTKEVDQANAAPGDHLIYSITLTNDGNMVADASLSDVLPAHTAWVGWVTQNGAVWDGVDTVSWAGDVAPGSDVVIAYEVQVETPLDNGTVIANLASVDDGVAPAFDIGPAQTTVHSAPNLTTSFKEVDVTSAAPGQELEYTLTIVNMGDMVAHDAEVLDYIPDHSSYVDLSVNASSGFASYQPLYDRIRWTGEVEPGTNVIITFRVLLDFPLDEGTEIVNWATVDDNFHPGATDTNYVVTTISAAPDMSGSSKAVNLTDASPGNELRYTITLVNAGSQTADAHVDDVLPGDVAFASGPVVTGGGIGGYDAGGRRIYWDGEVPPGHTVTIEYYVHVNDPLDDSTLITNDATVDDGYNPPFDTNEVETEVHSAPDLNASTKEVDLGTASPGDRLEYVITLENVGDMNATDVTVVDTLPPAYVTLVAVPPGAVYDGVAGTLTWAGLTVNTDTPVELTFEVDLDDVVPDGTFIVNHVEIDDGFNPGAVEREATTIVGSAPNLSTSTKEVDEADAAPGEYLEYTITLRNNGNATAVGATLTDVLPANVAWDGWVAQNGAAYDGGTNTVTWTGDVEPGVDQVIVYRVQIEFPLDDGTAIENGATVDDNFAGHDPFDVGPARTTVHSAPNLETSTKAVDLADANPGDELEYTITLVNSGDMTAHNAVVLDEIPAYATYVDLSAGATGGSVEYQAAYNRIRWTGEVEPGSDVVITYRVEVDFPLNDGTVIENFATVDDGIHSPFDTNTVATTIHSEPNLSTSTKVVDLGDAVPGQVLHYEITLVNSGDMVALATVQDVLPPEVSHAGGPTVLNGPPASWDPIARRIYWSGQVAPGTNVVIEYYVTVNSPLDDGTLIENTATLDDDFPGHDPFDVGPAQTTVHSAPDLGASMKEVDRAVAPPGELIEYTITLENGGNMDAAAVLMTDTLPVEVDFVSGPIVIGGGTASYDPVERQVRWSGPVNVDEPVTIRYTVRLDAGLAGGIVVANTATVDDGHGNVFEIGPAETYVGHEMGIRLTDGRDTVQPGERITYTLAFSGTEPLNSGLARIEIPDNTTLVAFSPGGEDKGIYVDWDIIGLPPGFYEERFIVVELDPVLDNGLVISTTAHVAGDGQGNQDSESVTVVSSPDLSVSTKQASADTAYAGDTLAYTIVLNNGGTMNGYTVAMTDTIPQYTSYVTGSVSGGSYDPLAQAITWAGPLNAGDQVTITFSVVITEPEFIPGGAYISNVAIVDDGFAGHAALEIEAETHLFNGARPDRYKVYLPLAFRNHAPSVNLPDLVVTDISVTPASPLAGQEVEIAITVENQGTRAPDSCFWIDLYINPTDLPIGINQGWFDAGSEAGLVWSLCELDPGESLTLTIDDAREEYSSFAGSFGAPGVQTIYAQIDSWNPGVPYGAVYESNEENNVYGPHQVTVTGAGGAVGADGVRATSEPPPRPNIPSH